MPEDDKQQEPERTISNGGQRAVDAYRRVMALQGELDAARDELQAALDFMPPTDEVAYFEMTERIRNGAQHASPENTNPPVEAGKPAEDGKDARPEQ